MRTILSLFVLMIVFLTPLFAEGEGPEEILNAEQAQKLVAHFKETELWLRPQLFDNAVELINKLFQAPLENRLKAACMEQVAKAVLLRTFEGEYLPGYLDETAFPETVEPKEIFLDATDSVRGARNRFDRFNLSIAKASKFLASEFSEKDAPTTLVVAKDVIGHLDDGWLPGKIQSAMSRSFARKVTEKALLMQKLKAELYLLRVPAETAETDDLYLYGKLLDEVASGKREPDWTKPSLALDELEKAYRWYEPHREVQNYISEVMIEVQKLVHNTGSTELKGKLLKEVVMVIHGFHEEISALERK